MIHLDTSVLIDALTGTQRSSSRLRELLASPQPVTISSVVLFEWLRGPRLQEELRAQEALFPSADAAPITSAEARLAAALYKKVKPPLGREADLIVAACAMIAGASLWTLNPIDFKNVPGLSLWALHKKSATARRLL
jgi:predicted nucleic acid-binding protein